MKLRFADQTATSLRAKRIQPVSLLHYSSSLRASLRFNESSQPIAWRRPRLSARTQLVDLFHLPASQPTLSGWLGAEEVKLCSLFLARTKSSFRRMKAGRLRDMPAMCAKSQPAKPILIQICTQLGMFIYCSWLESQPASQPVLLVCRVGLHCSASWWAKKTKHH